MESEVGSLNPTRHSELPPSSMLFPLLVAGKEKMDDALTYCGLSAVGKYFCFIYFEVVSHMV